MLSKDKNFVIQGGVKNYLGKTKEVKAPKFWKSSKDSPSTELVYITEAEKGLLLEANLHNSLDNGKPNVGASGLLSLDGQGDMGGSEDKGTNDDGSNNPGNTRSNFDYESEAYNVAETKNFDYESDAYNVKETNNFDYETDAYSNIKTTVTPQFNQDGKFTGVKTDGVGIVKGETYTAKTIQGVMLDSTISDKEKIATLNSLQAIANSTRNSGKPNVDIEGKAYIQNAIEVSLDSLKNDSFYDDLTSKMNLDASTYNDGFLDAPVETFLKSSIGITGVNPITGAMSIIGKSLMDAFKNKQALDILGFDGTKLKPNYAQVGDDGGILTNKEYLLGNTLNRDQINQAVPDIISGGDSLPDSMVNSYFDNVTGGSFSQSYNDIKSRLENQISTSQNGKVHKDNIFYDYLQKEGLLNG